MYYLTVAFIVPGKIPSEERVFADIFLSFDLAHQKNYDSLKEATSMVVDFNRNIQLMGSDQAH